MRRIVHRSGGALCVAEPCAHFEWDHVVFSMAVVVYAVTSLLTAFAMASGLLKLILLCVHVCSLQLCLIDSAVRSQLKRSMLLTPRPLLVTLVYVLPHLSCTCRYHRCLCYFCVYFLQLRALPVPLCRSSLRRYSRGPLCRNCRRLSLSCRCLLACCLRILPLPLLLLLQKVRTCGAKWLQARCHHLSTCCSPKLARVSLSLRCL
ncbi:hypothetical protein TRVL_05091 [Trypanosoma vivax]|nr:hypothetical protein TRVL_05091 [Trypanosoma vivax]